MRILFLRKLLARFKKCFIRNKGQETRIKIPVDIDSNEQILRAVFDPLQASISKKKIKEKAFMPPPGRSDLSVYRRKYASEDKCIESAKNIKINNNKLVGFASNRSQEILAASSYLSIVFSPMDEKNRYRNKMENVFTDDPGLPFHADIKYSPELQLRDSEPNTDLRIIAKLLARKSEFIVLQE